MSDSIEIQPRGPVRGTIRPPGSKSLTNRALVCAALAAGKSTLTGALCSEDTRVLIEALRGLGLSIDTDWGSCQVAVTGCQGNLPRRRAELFVGNSGTTIRFLTAMLAACHGEFRLDGVPRMRARPIGDLLVALRDLGANVRSESDNDCPPVVMSAHGLEGGTTQVRGSISSQFLSGLLLAAPYAARDVLLQLEGPLVSQPYVHMTIAVMHSFGVRVDTSHPASYRIAAGQRYRAIRYQVEPDASAASYFWAAAAITGGQTTVTGLSRRSLQGDVAFCDCLERMGCQVVDHADSITVTGAPLRGIEVDMNSISDTVQTLAAVALFADGPTTITGVAHIRHKETDRIGHLANELRKLGAEVDELADGLRIVPRPLHGVEIETYDDHRMAMSLALVGLRIGGVVISNPDCTQKTYPGFFADLDSILAS